MPLAVAIVAAVATAYSAVEQRKGAKQQRKAAAAEKRIQDVQNIRERTRAFAAARVSAAQIENREAISGISSSAAQGARGSLLSGTYGNIGFSNRLEQLGNIRYAAMARANAYFGRANTAGAVARIASSFSGGWGAASSAASGASADYSGLAPASDF